MLLDLFILIKIASSKIGSKEEEFKVDCEWWRLMGS